MRLVLPPLALALIATAAAANAQDPDVVRLLEAKGATLKWNQVPAGKSVRYGHAEVLVDAPLAKVQAASSVVAKEGATVDLYMKLPIRIGPVTIDQWEVVRFGPARASVSTFVIEGSGVRGNMKEGHILISARALDDKHCLVKVDLLLLPTLPAPQGMIDEELRDGAQDFINGIRDKSQGDNHVITQL
jgi:hypothetical protein